MNLFLKLLILLFLFCLFFYYAEIPLSLSPQNLPEDTVCIKNNCFLVQLAKTEQERESGLMFKSNLDKGKGMLFIFDKEEIYPFWMKNMLIPLDIVWINGSNKVVYISQNVQPCKDLVCPLITPTFVASYVLEVNAGVCKEIDLKIGDELQRL